MNGGTVSQAYLLGVREGRALLKQLTRDGIANLETYRAHIANLMALHGLSGDAAEARNGELAFWRNQVAKVTQ